MFVSDVPYPDYDAVARTLKNDNLVVSPAETQGLLTGLLCGGLSPQPSYMTSNNFEVEPQNPALSWRALLFDYTNDGAPWKPNSQSFADELLTRTHQQLSDQQMSFSLLLPDEDEGLSLRCDALSEWVNAFIVGFGLQGITAARLSDQQKEILNDLAEISQLGIDDQDDANEQAILLEQIVEHVRICAMTLFADFGIPQNQTPTLH